MKRSFLKSALSMVILWTAMVASIDAREADKELDWPAIHPAFADASFVTDKQVCMECHEEDVAAYRHTEHARIFQYGPKGTLQERDCESCHGPRSQHVDDPDDSLAMTGEQYSEVCLQCHQEGDRLYWKSGLHKTAGVNCVSCHDVMEKRSDKALLAAAEQSGVCYECHAEVRGQMQKVSHHPVREGKMDCSSCHNPHGSVGKSLLKAATVNETCFTCHQEKRGPFLWEHPVVREYCATCHDAHGSNNRDLLNTKASFLCLQCHSYGGHVNLPRYNRVSNPYGQGCVNCHITQHGSNHPSGAKFTR